MHDYINSHFSYDEILDESTIHESEKLSVLDIVSKKGKPFWIEKKKYAHTNFSSKLLLTEDSSSVYAENPEIIRDEKNKETPINYTSDFESFSEEIDECHSDNDETLENLSKTKRENNYSALLPNVNKIVSISRYNENRNSELSRDSRVHKSTFELRQINRKMMKSIETYRTLLPVYKKNQKVLSVQNHELKKMKVQKEKFFDIDYEIGFDKKVERKFESIDLTLSNIREEESFLTNKKKYFRNFKQKKIRTFVPISEEIIKSKYMILREDLLCKKREENAHTKKLDDLNAKIEQYEELIQSLMDREKQGLHEEYKIRKSVLEYDMTMVKTKVQERECCLMMEIAEMNNESSKLELEITKITQQINSEKLKDEIRQGPIKTSKSLNNHTVFHSLQKEEKKFRQ